MTLSLKPFDRGKARTPEQAMQDIRSYDPPTSEVMDALDEIRHMRPDRLHVEISENQFAIYPVHIRRKPCLVEITNNLLDGGAQHTQEEWQEITRKGQWRLPTLLEYTTIVKAIYVGKDNTGGQKLDEILKMSVDLLLLRQMLNNDFTQLEMMTATGIQSHDASSGEAYLFNNNCEKQAVFTPLDGMPTKIDEGQTATYFGTEDGNLVAESYKWVCGNYPKTLLGNVHCTQEYFPIVIRGIRDESGMKAPHIVPYSSAACALGIRVTEIEQNKKNMLKNILSSSINEKNRNKK